MHVIQAVLGRRLKKAGLLARLIDADEQLDDLTCLVWASLFNSAPYGINGLYFDGGPGPIRIASNVNLETWRWLLPALDQYQRQVDDPPLYDDEDVLRALALLTSGEHPDYMDHIFASVLPTPGEGFSFRRVLGNRAGALQFEEASDSGLRRIRLSTAYMDLCRRCNISAAPVIISDMRPGRTAFWMPLIPHRKIPVRPLDKTHYVVPDDIPNDEKWLIDSTNRRIYLGRQPSRIYARLIRRFGPIIDHGEAYRRLVFSVLTGTLAMDTTPPAITPVVTDDPKYPIRWVFTPIETLRPWGLPMKTAMSMRSRVLRQAAAYGHALGLNQEAVEADLNIVSMGIAAWKGVAEKIKLDEYETNYAMPAAVAYSDQSSLSRCVLGNSRRKLIRRGLTNVVTEE